MISDPEERERHDEDFARYAHFFRRATLFAWRKRLFGAWTVWLAEWKRFKRCTANLMPYLTNYSLRNEIKPCFIDWLERTFEGIPGDTPQEKIEAIQAIRLAKLERERRAMAYEDRDSQIAPMLLTTSHGRAPVERCERHTDCIPRSLLFAPSANVCDICLAEQREAKSDIPEMRAPTVGRLASDKAEADALAPKMPEQQGTQRQKSQSLDKQKSRHDLEKQKSRQSRQN
jgi:hypothetical protein